MPPPRGKNCFYYAYDTLADKTNRDRLTVSSAINKLIKAGLVVDNGLTGPGVRVLQIDLEQVYLAYEYLIKRRKR